MIPIKSNHSGQVMRIHQRDKTDSRIRTIILQLRPGPEQL